MRAHIGYAHAVKDQRTAIAVVVALIGLVAVVVGVIYVAVAAHSLPSILGPVHGFSGHRWKRGLAALALGAVLLAGGWYVARVPRSAPR
jgi:hypothetical protein